MGQEYKLAEKMPLLEWFANNHKIVGATLETLSDNSQEASQFMKEFGGIRVILQYQVDFQGMEYQGGNNEFFYLDEYQVVDMGPANCASPSSIRPKGHTFSGIQTDPCLTTGRFPEFNP